MAAKKYSEAAAAYKEIIDLGDKAIDPDYASLFLPSNENSSENIFSMQYLQDLAGNAIPQNAFPEKDGGWCLINVAAGLFEAYQFKDGTPFSYDSPLYNPDNLGENRDPRLDYTIYYNGSTFKGAVYDCHPDSQSPDKVMGGQTTQTGFMMRKYFDETFSGDLNSYGGNVPVIRYAEVLLTYAEAQNEASGPDQSVYDAINQLRRRPDINMQEVPKGLTKDQMREVIRRERRIELTFEGLY